MQSQLDASDKLNSATQARIKFEQQIADLKSKTQLTADQKSILSRSDEILQAYKQQEALQNSVKTLDDYRKMQEQVKTKDERTNDLLKSRLELLEKAKATGQLKPGEYEKHGQIFIKTPICNCPRRFVMLWVIPRRQAASYQALLAECNSSIANSIRHKRFGCLACPEGRGLQKAGAITAEGEARMQKLAPMLQTLLRL